MESVVDNTTIDGCGTNMSASCIRIDHLSHGSGYAGSSITAGTRGRAIATVRNQLEDDTSVTIADVDVETPDDERPKIINIKWDTNPFGSGESVAVRGTLVCEETGSNVAELVIWIEGPGITADLLGDTDTRRFVVRCE